MSAKQFRAPRLRGCESCRRRHLRCDDQDPCAQCSISDRKCVRITSTRFQHSCIPSSSRGAQFSFHSDQPWCSTPEDLSFLEESDTLKLEYRLQDSGTSHLRTEAEGLFHESELLPFDFEDGTPASNLDEPRFFASPSLGTHQSGAEAASNQQTDRNDVSEYWEQHAPCNQRTSNSPVTSRSFMRSEIFPVADRKVAGALKKFQSDLTPAIDLGTGPGLNDSLISMGATDRPLVDAVLSICLGERVLLQRTPIFLEEVTGPTSRLAASFLNFKTRVAHPRPADAESPITSPYDNSHFSNELCSASPRKPGPSFWFILQQETYLAIINQEPLAFDSTEVLKQKFDAHLPWSNRLQLHLADVSNFCFGSGDASCSTFEDLVDFTMEWVQIGRYQHSSTSFGYADETSAFPDVYVVGDDLLKEVQIYHLVKILLSAHDPSLPRLGKRKKESMRMVDAQMEDDLMIVCGLANSSGGIAKGHVMACLAISLAGDRLSNRYQQEAVMEILRQTMSTARWNTAPVQKHLQEEWDW